MSLVSKIASKAKTEAMGTYIILWEILSSRFPYGTNVYESDWDLVIILDSCRVDALSEVSDEYEYLPTNIPSRKSVGSTSKEWLQRTFCTKYKHEISNTGYISANPYTKHLQREHTDRLNYVAAEKAAIYKQPLAHRLTNNNIVTLEEFGTVVSLSDSYSSDEEFEFLYPETVTDVTIDYMRKKKSGRVIVHYMQPHEPYFTRDGEISMKSPFVQLIQSGDFQSVWDAYVENLRFVLDDVERLLSNVDAEEVLITSDHGELFGTWGIFSHEAGILHPSVRNVPWVKTSGSDSGSHTPSVDYERLVGIDDRGNDEQLEALGYM